MNRFFYVRRFNPTAKGMIVMLKKVLMPLFAATLAVTAAAVEFEKNPKSAAPDEEIVYKKTDGEDLKLYLYKPENWKATDHRPLMLMYHGGGWRGGNPAQYANQCRDYAKKGFVAITASYRLADTKGDVVATHLRTVEDAKSAIRYAKAHAAELGIDPAKIITAGSSAGGHLAISVALLDQLNDPADDLAISPAPAAVILMCPVIDAGPKPGYDAIYNRLKERYKEFSPIDHLRKDMPPQLILLGDKDHILSAEHAKTYQAKVQALGGRCDVAMFEGAKHAAFYQGKYYTESIPTVTRFLTELKLMPEAQ
jgi:acetyl esterase/lipase